MNKILLEYKLLSLTLTKCFESAVFCPEQVTGRPHLSHLPWVHQEHHRSFQKKVSVDSKPESWSWTPEVEMTNTTILTEHLARLTEHLARVYPPTLHTCLPSLPDELSHILQPPFPFFIGMLQTFGQQSLGRSNMAYLSLVLKPIQAILHSLSSPPTRPSCLHF